MSRRTQKHQTDLAHTQLSRQGHGQHQAVKLEALGLDCCCRLPTEQQTLRTTVGSQSVHPRPHTPLLPERRHRTPAGRPDTPHTRATLPPAAFPRLQPLPLRPLRLEAGTWLVCWAAPGLRLQGTCPPLGTLELLGLFPSEKLEAP